MAPYLDHVTLLNMVKTFAIFLVPKPLKKILNLAFNFDFKREYPFSYNLSIIST